MVQFPANIGALRSIGTTAVLQPIVKFCLDTGLQCFQPEAKGKKIATAYAWLQTELMVKVPVAGLGTGLAHYKDTSEHLGRCVEITYTDTIHVTCPHTCGKVVEDQLVKLGEGCTTLLQGIPGQFEGGIVEVSNRLRVPPHYLDSNGEIICEKGGTVVWPEKYLSAIR